MEKRMKNERRIRTSASIQQRAKELRQKMTPAEKMLWESLRNRRLGGHKFRRQHPLGPFIADFYCAEKNWCLRLMATSMICKENRMNSGRASSKSSVIGLFGFGTKRSRPTSAWCSRKSLKPASPPLPEWGEGSGVRADSLLPKLGEGPGMRAARDEAIGGKFK